jgi:hypothetical protein
MANLMVTQLCSELFIKFCVILFSFLENEKDTTGSKIRTLTHGYGFRSSLQDLCDLARPEKIKCHSAWQAVGKKCISLSD